MKKLILFSMTLVFVSTLIIIGACSKETLEDQITLKSGKKAVKIDICHYSEEDSTWDIITISENAWAGHEKHGDVRLDDWDQDGFVPDNECGIEPMGDMDDFDYDNHPPIPGQNPDDDVKIDTIRLAGEPGDLYVKPICYGESSYVAYFYISGIGLPQNAEEYSIFVNNIEYSVVYIDVTSESDVVVLLMDLPSGETNIDIEIRINTNGKLYNFPTFEDVYDAPVCL